jgi:hypothetical protein
MPTLLELQRAARACLIAGETPAIAAFLAEGIGPDRLDIYRNTIFFGLTKALRLTYPAVERLVGAGFFYGAAQTFVTECLPRAAYLDQFGGAFADFLRCFTPAASLAYLADVARLEWAVSCALHAPDVKPLELESLAEIAPERQGDVSFKPHPSVGLLRADYPADAIWRAVLGGDDRAFAALDLSAGPVFLLIEQRAAGVEVARLQEPAWRFLDALCRGEPLHAVMDSARDRDVSSLLAEHLAAGRLAAFTLSPPDAAATPQAA